MIYSETITLLDRTATNRTPSTDLPASVSGGNGNGDLKPYRIRLTMSNAGIEKINNGQIKLRVDEHKTFLLSRDLGGGVKTPVLVDENAKNKYLIEAQISQTDSDGTTIYGKKFRFVISQSAIDLDQTLGATITLHLTEIQYRIKETLTAYRHWFTDPKTTMVKRANEFNKAQLSSGNSNEVILTGLDGIDISQSPKQHYLPTSPQTVHQTFQEIFGRLARPVVQGGSFLDYYYDFFPNSTLTNAMDIEAKEEGSFPASGTGYDYDVPILKPLSVEAHSAGGEETQSIISDFKEYKNNVIIKGASESGSLPTNHSIFGSQLEHGKHRDEWNSATTYRTGDQVKKTFTVTGVNEKVIRFFELTKVIAKTSTEPSKLATHTSNTSPDQDEDNWKEDFVMIPEWSNYGRYFKDEIVYHKDGSTIKFYKATADGQKQGAYDTRDYDLVDCDILNPKNASTENPKQDTGNWSNLHSTGLPNRSTDNFTDFSSYNPMNMPDDWRKNLAGLKSGSLSGGSGEYTGLAWDWNFCKDTYGISDFTNDYERLNIKWVAKKDITDPTNTTQVPDGSIWHGQRYLLGDMSSTANTNIFHKQFVDDGYGTSSDVSNGSLNYRIAEWDEVYTKWRFSKQPDSNETITNLEDGKIWAWSGSAWIVKMDTLAWDGNSADGGTGTANRHGQCFHIVKNIYQTTGSTGIPSQALEYRYHWYVLGESAGAQELLSSRGAWINFWHPFPRQASAHGGIGYQMGGDGWKYNSGTLTPNTIGTENYTSLNTFNTNSDRFGDISGWNNGLKSEDMGRISGLGFRLKLELTRDWTNMNYNNSGTREIARPFARDERISGVANIPMIFWAVDSFDRIYFHKFKLRRNGEWENVVIPFSTINSRDNSNLYFARWDELAHFFGYVIGGLNFTLKEKEFTGVKFDWRFVRGWGIMYAESYHENGFYEGGTETWWDGIEQSLKQIGGNIWNLALEAGESITDFFTGSGSDPSISGVNPEHANFVIRQASLAIDDLHYVKELYVNSDDTPVSKSRSMLESFGDPDYLNCKQYARSRRARSTFFPQTYHITALGNVKIRLGHKFKVTGDRVPHKYQTTLQEQDLICTEVQHIIDHGGYHIDIQAHRKFVTNDGGIET